MKLYVTVAFLTFLGSFGLYTATQISGAAHAIGGGQSGPDLFASFNPFALLQPGRLRELMSSNSGLPRAEPFRSNFDASTIRIVQPKFDLDAGRKAWTGPQYRPPVVHTPPSYRPFR